jgi:hypothetical protein
LLRVSQGRQIGGTGCPRVDPTAELAWKRRDRNRAGFFSRSQMRHRAGRQAERMRQIAG